MPIQTVTELNQSIKLILENGFSFISVSGEISNLRRPYSGHLYFSLKDEQSQIRAVLFKMQQRYLLSPLEDGNEVICHGRLSLYEPRGEYQLIIDRVELKGDGVLQLAYEKLKQKLSAEGLFEQQYKKKLPFLPARIALITSPTGAAVHDFLKISTTRCRCVPIDIYAVRVQGDEAAKEISATIKIINEKGRADLIVICRGGGSIEDLWPFNDEMLARTIFNSNIPIISAIGHEIDFTIADLTADFRAPTPTAAAEAALPDAAALREIVNKQKNRMILALTNRLVYLENKISSLRRIIGSPAAIITHVQMKIDYAVTRSQHAISTLIQEKRFALLQVNDLLLANTPAASLKRQKNLLQTTAGRLERSISTLIREKNATLRQSKELLKAVSPLAVLNRGYAIVLSEDKKSVIRSKNQVSAGDLIKIRLSDGELDGQIAQSSEK